MEVVSHRVVSCLILLYLRRIVSRGVGSLHGDNLGGTVQDSNTLNSTGRLDNSTPQARYTEC